MKPNTPAIPGYFATMNRINNSLAAALLDLDGGIYVVRSPTETELRFWLSMCFDQNVTAMNGLACFQDQSFIDFADWLSQ